MNTRLPLLRAALRVFLPFAGVAGIFLLAFLSSPPSIGASAPTVPVALIAPEYGVYTEFGLANVPMAPGTNVRRFNSVNERGGTHISFDQTTGYVTLMPGVYRVSGYSITTYGYALPTDQQQRLVSEPGYAFLWNVDAKKIAITGSMQDPMLSLTSQVDDVLTVQTATKYFLGHQNGNSVAGVYLETLNPGDPTGTNHVFARLVIQRLTHP